MEVDTDLAVDKHRPGGSTEEDTVPVVAGSLVAGTAVAEQLWDAGGGRVVVGRPPVVAGGYSCSCAVVRLLEEALDLGPALAGLILAVATNTMQTKIAASNISEALKNASYLRSASCQ